MNQVKKAYIAFFIAVAFLVAPLATDALSGTNANRVKVKVYTKQGGDWFRALTQRTDNDGVLKFKNALPGWYKMVVDDDDEASGQTLAVQLRMTDVKGRKLKEKTDVDLYYDNNGTDTLISTIETDDDGWLKVSGLTPGIEYKMDISDNDMSSVSKRDGKARIKVKAKIDKSDWFPSAYKRTDESMILELENVLPGKYKFKYKDRAVTEPFTLRLRVRDEDGNKIKEAVDVDLYAYVNKERVPIGTMRTDTKGWVTIPGVMTHMKYRIDVDD